MARRTILVCASVLIGLASIAGAPSDAFAKKKTTTKAPEAAAVATAAPVIVPVNGGPVGWIPRCFDSVIRYLSPPCY